MHTHRTFFFRSSRANFLALSSLSILLGSQLSALQWLVGSYYLRLRYYWNLGATTLLVNSVVSPQSLTPL